MEELLTGAGLISLLTLTFLEIVLGIDNIIFISILAGRLPENQQAKARNIGLALALFTRIALLMGISWLIGLTKPLMSLQGFDLSARDLILFSGGLFLLWKGTTEIHSKLEGEEENISKTKHLGFTSAIVQIILFDLVFSFDSILTAVGLVDTLIIMVLAIVISIIVMLIFVKKISDFIHKHPTLKMLALAFLILIGVMLILDGLHQHVPKGYIYFSIAFSLSVELLNLKMRKKTAPVKLKDSVTEAKEDRL